MTTVRAPFAYAIAAVVDLLPLGWLVFAFYGALCLIPAKLGVALRRRLDPSQSSSSPRES